MPISPSRWLVPLCLWLCALLPLAASAQLDVVHVFGTVKDMSTSKKLDGVTVTVYKNGAKLVDVVTNASGKYEVNLDYGAEYKIVSAKPTFVGKNITIDTRNIPEEDRQGGFAMNIDFTMMAEIQGVDYSILLEPFGKSVYVKSSGTFEWDHEYTARMRDAQARLLKEYENRKKREANAEAEYAKAMKLGTDAMNASDFKKAVAQFTDALDLKPNDPVATAKLSDARMRLDGLEAEKTVNDQYAALIKEADGLFSKKDYETARTKYTAALDLKENEAHPKQRVKEIEGLLADLAKAAEEEKKAKEIQEKYDAAIAAADNAFKSEDLDQAQSKYTEASGIKTEEKYPKDQLAAVAAKRKELADKAAAEAKDRELQEKYQAAIAAGDAAFNGGNWDEAAGKYNEALRLKSEEKYPQDQLAAIQVKKDEAARKADEERLAKELQEKYQTAINAGDAAFKANDLDGAAARYNEALGFKAEEKYPKDQLAAIEGKRQELADKEAQERKDRELNEQYQTLIAAADAAFNSADWDKATAKYTEASQLKPAESYPKDQLAAMDRKKEELAKKAEQEQKARELEEQYMNAIAAADAAFDSQDWAAATTRYTEAAGHKPSESYPKDRLALIKVKIAEADKLKEQEELNARYAAAIAEADQGFDSGDFTKAKGKYQAALEMKPAESYPKQRLGEIDAAIAEQAKLAEQEKKKQEFEARYAELIGKADKAYNEKEFSAALNDYKDALQMKPDQEHPKSRIASIEQQLDAVAQESAEKERLLREQQDRDKRYADLITAADKAFAAEDLQKARTEYQSALDVKSDESHPQQRIAAIDDLIAKRAQESEAEQRAAEERARQEAEAAKLAAEKDAEERARQEAEAARLAADKDAEERARQEEMARLAAEREELEKLAAEQEAEERARKEEADRLAAQMSAAERAQQLEAERIASEEAADREARYKAHIAAADRAFSGNEFEEARRKYNDALAVDPGAQYPKDRLGAIDSAIAAEEERRRNDQSADELARLAAEAEREAELQRLADERLAMEQEAEEARLRAEEEERRKREGEMAVEERYNAAIAEAEDAMAEKRYQEARGKFAMASDLKPQEAYPVGKIDQIDKLLADQERARQEAELAQQKREPEKVRTHSTIDIRKEQEAEQFMRAAKEREEAEKYERIKKKKSDLEQEQIALAEKAADRRSAQGGDRGRHLNNTVGLYAGDEENRRRNAQELEERREALALAEAERRARAAERREQRLQDNRMTQEDKAARAEHWEQVKQEQNADMERTIEDIRTTEAIRAQRGLEKNIELKERADAMASREMDMRSRGEAAVQDRYREVEDARRTHEMNEARSINRSEQSRLQAKEHFDQVQKELPQNFADHNRSKLASEYQPGITEESYTEGNKVIIRRVVVMGNKADEYSKVIAKWGTFYFKNGQSITEAMWSNATEIQ